MIVIRMDYEGIGVVGIRTNFNGKIRNHYIRYVVDEYSIDKAILETKGNKWVVAFDYVGDYQHLFDIVEKPSIPVIITKELKDINELSINFFMKSIPDWVTVSIKTPSDFCDMRVIENLSMKFPNIRFCGGKFLRLPNCRIGCIQKEDIPKSISENKISFYTEGCACALLTMNYDDVEGKEILFKDVSTDNLSIEKEVQVNEIKKKKVISSIEDLLNM